MYQKEDKMFIQLLRLLLGKKLKRFEFKPFQKEKKTSLQQAGLYVHVPFCVRLCDFCPYFKIKFDPVLAEQYVNGLLKEIDWVKETYDISQVPSVYYGGGTPALISHRLGEINSKIRKQFPSVNSFAIELHPDNLTVKVMDDISEARFNMISVGIQSFDTQLLKNLGRNNPKSPEKKLNILSKYAFKTIDIDLIFGIPGQTPQLLADDFHRAVQAGATQISTYPFIDFSYANNAGKPMKKKRMKRLLESLIQAADQEGFERSSVWTFKKRGSEKYSSITRDFFIGMGPSGTTLTLENFYINTFSVPQYCQTVDKGKRPIAVQLDFTQRWRMLYWLFWSCYEMTISRVRFQEIFNQPLTGVFGRALKLADFLKFIETTNDGYRLTDKGAYYYHLAEQALTHTYIDKTWKNLYKTPWPKGFKI
jgi:oxygen-independent coproporphyrinogen-3 oxidase